MSNIFNINTHGKPAQTEIENEATAWIVQLHDAEPTKEDLKAFQCWLQTSTTHRQTFRNLAHTWGDMDVMVELAFPQTVKQYKTRTFPIPGFHLAYAATALLFLLTLAILSWQYLPIPAEQYQFRANYATVVGEMKKIALPDGSDMRLNTGSKTNVVFNEEARFVHLLAGEAHFEVFHDENKPFVVYAGKIAVRAVGTAFSVYIKGDSVDVIVTDGKVKVASLKHAVIATDEASLALLDNADSIASFVEGQHAVFQNKIELVETIEPQEITKKLSWRDGMLIFDGDSLQDVVNEITRYTSKKIIILDSKIRDLKIGGYFRTGEITPMLDTLAANFNLNVEEINENLIYLSEK